MIKRPCDDDRSKELANFRQKPLVLVIVILLSINACAIASKYGVVVS